jgi:hypothetical protein
MEHLLTQYFLTPAAFREDSIGPSDEERTMDLAMLQARNTQDALQIRQREV